MDDITKDKFRQFGTIVKNLINRVDELTAKVADLEAKQSAEPAEKPRNIRAPAESIIAALHMLDVQGMSIQDVSATKVLTRSRVQGLSGWPDNHKADFIEENDDLDIYSEGVNSERWHHVAPNYAEVVAEKESGATEAPDTTETTETGDAQ